MGLKDLKNKPPRISKSTIRKKTVKYPPCIISDTCTIKIDYQWMLLNYELNFPTSPNLKMFFMLTKFSLRSHTLILIIFPLMVVIGIHRIIYKEYDTC